MDTPFSISQANRLPFKLEAVHTLLRTQELKPFAILEPLMWLTVDKVRRWFPLEIVCYSTNTIFV
jgi:hypothetical protein